MVGFPQAKVLALALHRCMIAVDNLPKGHPDLICWKEVPRGGQGWRSLAKERHQESGASSVRPDALAQESHEEPARAKVTSFVPMSPSGEFSAVVPAAPASLGTAEACRGLPSRWLRKGLDKDRDFRQKQTLDRLCTDLTSRETGVRQKAAESLDNSCKVDSFALALAGNIQPVLCGLKPNESVPVKLAILGALRSLAEKGHAPLVALHSKALLQCLKDESAVVQRKVSALYRVLAEEGAASAVAQDVKSLMQCFEATQEKGAPLVAPLDALSSIAIAGEGAAVASVIEPLLRNLKDSRPKIRLSTCTTLGAIASGGAKELLGSLGLCPEAKGSGHQVTLFEMLVCTALDDNDDDVRLEAADALRCLPEADPDTCDDTRQKFPQLVQRLRAKPYGDRKGRKGKAIKIISDAMGVTCEFGEGEEASQTGTLTLCAICQEPLETHGWCPEGKPRTLHCKHSFHDRCCSQWFEWVTRCGRMPSCPVCRSIGHDMGK